MGFVKTAELMHRAAVVVHGQFKTHDTTVLGPYHALIANIACHLCGLTVVDHEAGMTVGQFKASAKEETLIRTYEGFSPLAFHAVACEKKRQDRILELSAIVFDLVQNIPPDFPKYFYEEFFYRPVDRLQKLLEYGEWCEAIQEFDSFGCSTAAEVVSLFNQLKKAWKRYLDVAAEDLGEDGVRVSFTIPL